MKRLKWTMITAIASNILVLILFVGNLWLHNIFLAGICCLSFILSTWINLNSLFHYRESKDFKSFVDTLEKREPLNIPPRAWDKNKQGQHLN